jgi:hypothetical protein
MADLSAAANVVDDPQDINRIGSANRRWVLCGRAASIICPSEVELEVLSRPPYEILGAKRSASIDHRQCDQTIKTRRAMVSSRPVPCRCAKTQIAPSARDRIPRSASHAPAQFRMEFGANRRDDVCGIILGEAADEKHLISQRQARCDVLWKHRAGSRPCKR